LVVDKLPALFTPCTLFLANSTVHFTRLLAHRDPGCSSPAMVHLPPPPSTDGRRPHARHVTLVPHSALSIPIAHGKSPRTSDGRRTDHLAIAST
jgi:hypothetical protein